MKDRMSQDKGFLKEKLEQYQENPPESVWNAISAGLENRRGRGMVIITLAAAASIALAVTLGINFFGPHIPVDAEMAESAIPHTAPLGTGDPELIHLDPAPVPEKPTSPDHLKNRPDHLKNRPVHRETMQNRVAETMAVLAAGETKADETLLAEESAVKDDSPSEFGKPSGSEVKTENRLLAPDGPADPERSGQAGTAIEAEVPQTETLVPETWQKDPRWMVGAALSPLYTYRDVESRAMAVSSDDESGTVSYATGVQVGYRTTRRLAIESGVFYNKMGIDIGAPGIQLFSDELDFSPIGNRTDQSNIMAISNSVGNIVSNSGDIYVNNYKVSADYQTNSPTGSWAGPAVSADQGIRQNLDYLEIPLNLRYTLVDRSIQVQLVGGMSTNLLVNNYVTMETPDGSTEIGTMTNIRNVNYSGNAGIGLIYHFLDHFSLSLEPRFRYFLHSVNDATLPSTRPYTFGLYTGLNYFF